MNINSLPLECFNLILFKSFEKDLIKSYEDSLEESCALLGKLHLVCKEWFKICSTQSLSSPPGHIYRSFLRDKPLPERISYTSSLKIFFLGDLSQRFLIALLNAYDVAISFLSTENINPYAIHRYLQSGLSQNTTIVHEIIRRNNASALKRLLEIKELIQANDQPASSLNILEQFFIFVMASQQKSYSEERKPLLDLLKSDSRVFDLNTKNWKLLTKNSWKLIWEKTFFEDSNNRIFQRQFDFRSASRFFHPLPFNIFHDPYFFKLQAASSSSNTTDQERDNLRTTWIRASQYFSKEFLSEILHIASHQFFFESLYTQARLRFSEFTKGIQNSLLKRCLLFSDDWSAKNTHVILQNFTGSFDLEEKEYIKLLQSKYISNEARDKIINYLVPSNGDIYNPIKFEEILGLLFNHPNLQECIHSIKGKDFICDRLGLTSLSDSDSSDDESFEPDYDAPNSPFAIYFNNGNSLVKLDECTDLIINFIHGYSGYYGVDYTKHRVHMLIEFIDYFVCTVLTDDGSFEEFLINLFKNKKFPQIDRDEIIDYLCTPLNDDDQTGGLPFLEESPLLHRYISELKGDTFIEENIARQSNFIEDLSDSSDDEGFEPPAAHQHLFSTWNLKD